MSNQLLPHPARVAGLSEQQSLEIQSRLAEQTGWFRLNVVNLLTRFGQLTSPHAHAYGIGETIPRQNFINCGSDERNGFEHWSR